jgi:predicted transcriptional regulator
MSAGGRVISYSAVKAVLNNLAEKGWLRKERNGKATSFEPLMNEDEFNAAVMSSVIGSLKRNYGTPVIAQFVDQIAVDEETIEEFERLLAARKAELGR